VKEQNRVGTTPLDAEKGWAATSVRTTASTTSLLNQVKWAFIPLFDKSAKLEWTVQNTETHQFVRKGGSETDLYKREVDVPLSEVQPFKSGIPNSDCSSDDLGRKPIRFRKFSPIRNLVYTFSL
jgi:hypothetical protein